MSESGIAVGVPMFSREQALANLLKSVPEYVNTVYIADNGRETEREIYTEAYPFTLHIIDVAYDAGIGACRFAITNECTEPYLWVGDNDMRFTSSEDLKKLRRVLESHPELGGVSGWLLEDNTVRAGARDLKIHGKTAIKEAVDKPIVHPDPYPFARFDFIPQCGLFRTEVYETYNYDPEIESTEHLDFFLGQLDAGEWEFASTPAVLIQHDRYVNQEYRENRGNSHVDFEYTAEKWGVTDTAPGCRPDWGYVRGRSIPQQMFDVMKRVTPPSVWLPIKRGAKKVGLQ